MSQGTALVTGASSGIGAEFARQLAAEGMDQVLVARRADRLATLGDELTKKFSVRCHTIASDLSQPEAALQAEGRRGAKRAPHAAAHLRGDAQRQPLAELRGDQHALDLRAVNKSQEKLSRRILRPRQPYDTRPAEGECSSQPVAQRVR